MRGMQGLLGGSAARANAAASIPRAAGSAALVPARRHASEELPTASPDTAWLVVTVRDTGCGIKEEDVARLFQPFQQTRQGMVFTGASSGLGLFISRGIVRQMGGDLEVHSRIGEGSAFRLQVPLKVR